MDRVDSAPSARLGLTTDVQYVKGVGPRLGALLGSRGVLTVEDLIYLLPFRYEDRSQIQAIHSLAAGDAATVVAQVRMLNFSRTRRGVQRLEMTMSDGTGTLLCSWYHAEFLRDRFSSGQTLALFGKVSRERGRLEMAQPEFEILEAGAEAGAESGHLGGSLKLGRIVPVYEAIGSLSAGRLRRLIHDALAALPAEFPDPLPEELRLRLELPTRRAALEQVHFPDGNASLTRLQEARSRGHVRLILEELFCLQAGLELKRRRVKRQTGAAMAVHPAIRERLKALLPFHPTADQKQVLKEIVDDLCSGRPMRRLLQGDVGSGKTIVALEAAVIAIENGYQVALMAPTQILAEQHYLYACRRLPGYRIELVTGARRRRAAAARPLLPAQLAIGTQALLEGSFTFDRLGLVIVDEQHRFGVLQRFHLMHKGANTNVGPAPPATHVLVMTATPIPRTLALTLYGDLDTSVIRHSPPGRLPILTRVVAAARACEVYEFLRRRVVAGRQGFCIYPIIEESETLDLKPALLMHQRLQAQFPDLRIGLLHGRLRSEEKQAVMNAFRAGQLHILVSTTVVEVGVDVPNATVMVIEHAERFGIAQLHQLRGRIGRPQPAGASIARAEQSHCFLIHGEPLGEAGRRRLAALARTRNGFELAEEDLKLRGPGEFFGTRQSGMPALTVAEPIRDQELMQTAQQEARAFLDRATPDELTALVRQIQQRWQRRYGLVEVG